MYVYINSCTPPKRMRREIQEKKKNSSIIPNAINVNHPILQPPIDSNLCLLSFDTNHSLALFFNIRKTNHTSRDCDITSSSSRS